MCVVVVRQSLCYDDQWCVVVIVAGVLTPSVVFYDEPQGW